MKKLISIVLLLSLVFSLAACGHEHTWQEATCTQPKTCAECGETEGEALGHDPTEATVWEPSVCSRCGEVMGEALEPDFVAHGINVVDISDVPTEMFGGDALTRVDLDDNGWYYEMPESPSSFISTSYDEPDKNAMVYVCLADYSIIESDEEHEGLPGYEWRIATFDCYSSIRLSWMWLTASDEDYYDIEGHDDSALGPYFTATWQGEDYTECIRNFTSTGEISSVYIPTGDGASLFFSKTTLVFSFRVPVGYDGMVVCFRNQSVEFNKGQYIYDVMRPTDLFVRLT